MPNMNCRKCIEHKFLEQQYYNLCSYPSSPYDAVTAAGVATSVLYFIHIFSDFNIRSHTLPPEP